MDYRDWARGDDTPVTLPRSRSSDEAIDRRLQQLDEHLAEDDKAPADPSDDRPRRTGSRRVRPTAAAPDPDAVSQWDPLGASGSELAAITQLEDTASFKLPKGLFDDGPGDDGDMVIVPTGGGRRRTHDEQPPSRARRGRDEADDEIELSSGGRRRRDVSDSRSGRGWPEEAEFTSGGRRRRDISDSRAAADDVESTNGGRRRRRADDDEIEMPSDGRRRRDVADSRTDRSVDDDIELSSGGRRRRDAADSRAGRDWSDTSTELSAGGRRRRALDDDIELSSGQRRRPDASDSRAGRWSTGTDDPETTSGGRRRRAADDYRDFADDDPAVTSGGRRRGARDLDDDPAVTNGGRRRSPRDLDDDPAVTNGRRRRTPRDLDGDVELSSGGRRRSDDVADSRAGRWSGGTDDPELTSGGRRRRAAADSEPVSRGRRRVDDAGGDTGRGSWRDEATDMSLPSIGYSASASETPTRGRRARGDAPADGEPVSRGRRRRHAESEAGAGSWRSEQTETELPELGARHSDTGSIQVPLRGRPRRHAEDADSGSGEPGQTRRRARHGDSDAADRGRRGWSEGASDTTYPETTGTRIGRGAADDDPPARGRRWRDDDPDAFDTSTRRGARDPIESTGTGRSWSEGLAERPRGGSRHAETEPVDRGRRGRAGNETPVEPAGRSRRGRAEEATPVDPASRGRRGRDGSWRDDVEQTGHGRRADERDPEAAPGRDWRDGTAGRRGRDDEPDRSWRDEAARGDVPTQRRRGRDDGDPPAGGDAPGRRGSWAGEPDSDRWRHPDMTGEWSRRAMAPIEPAPDRPDDRRPSDDRPTQDGGRRGRWEAARDAGDGGGGPDSRRAEERGRRRNSGHRPGDDGLDTGSWERMTDTGQYDSTTSTGEWDRLVGSVDDEADEKFDAFWSGHRLAGDDPRWVETPATAPRSPAVGLPDPRRPEPDGYDEVVPRRGRSKPEADALARAAMPPALDATDPGWGAPARAARRAPAPATRPGPAPPRQAPQQQRRMMGWQQEEFEQLDTADNGGFLAAVLYAAAWYAVPVLAFGIWLMTLPAVSPDDCVSDVTGGGCDSPRAQALEGLLSGIPHFGIALGISLIAAIALRWLGHSWRAGSVGLAAAVVGGGMAAVLNSVFTGQPLG
ncbi:hypothetical protein [Asanoa sp. NPDC050611]|uniref:hypothetical protein n=1 Tax=Asanoa sp. NPDC050611 TaxID=3157098 RepID=UPI0033F05452